MAPTESYLPVWIIASTSGSAMVAANPNEKATPVINHKDPLRGKSAPMNLPIGRMPKSMPRKKRTRPARDMTHPIKNWINSSEGALTRANWRIQTAAIRGAMDLTTSMSFSLTSLRILSFFLSTAVYCATRTSHFDSDSRCIVTLPRRSFSMIDFPRLPTTIRSTSRLRAFSLSFAGA